MNKVLDLTDNELIQSFQEGNTRAFDALLDRHQERIYNTILFMVKDSYLAEDLIQEIFIKIIDNLKQRKYNEEGKFSAWIMRIAHNLCIDYFRGKKKMPMTRGNDDWDPFDFISSGEKNSEEATVNKQVLSDAKKLLSHLPDEQKEIVMMRLYYDMSFKEISDTLNISINTALGRMRYALINLRKLIEKNQMEMTLK